MKKTGKTLTAILVASAVILGSTLGCFAAQKADTADNIETNEALETDKIVEATEEAVTEAVEKLEDKEEIKTDDEVVYVFTDSEGKVEKVMDSIWIADDEDKVQSAADADLPIDVNVKYYLDGKAIAPKDLHGKSGHLKVDVLFTNNRYEMKSINGKEEKIYVPFLASAITALDGEKYANVTVSNGRVIYDGARYAVVGVSLPGLKEDLDISANTVDIPESVTFEADVTDFEDLGMYLLISNSVFSNLDIDTTEKMDTLKEDLKKIDDAMEALLNGSDEIYDGLVKLAEGAGKLSAGVSELSNGLQTIDSNSATLVNGSKEVFNTLLKTASDQLNASGINVGTLTIDNYATVLNSVLSEGYTKKIAYGTVEAKVKENESVIRAAVTEAVTAQVSSAVEDGVRAEVTSKVTAAVRENVKQSVAAKVAEAYGITAEQALANPETASAINAKVEEQMTSDAIKNTIDAQVSAQMSSDEVKAIIESTKAAKLASDEVKAIIDSKTQETMNAKVSEYEASAEVQGQISAADKKISDLKASLDNYNKYYRGVIAYTEGVSKASAGAKKLNDSMPELIKGIDALKNGEKQLSDGLNKFNDEGVSKLNELVNTTLEGMVERFNTVKEVSSDYASYGTDGEATKDGVKFIYKIKTVK